MWSLWLFWHKIYLDYIWIQHCTCCWPSTIRCWVNCRYNECPIPVWIQTNNSLKVKILNAFEVHKSPYNITVMYSVPHTFVSCQDAVMDALICIEDVSKMNIESGYTSLLGPSLTRSGSSSDNQILCYCRSVWGRIVILYTEMEI